MTFATNMKPLRQFVAPPAEIRTRPMLSLAFAATSFNAPGAFRSQYQNAVLASPPMMMAKGFGKTPEKEVKAQKKADKPKSEATQQRDKAAADFDALKNQGSPEYMVLIRELPEGGEPSKWYPVGGIAVPRSSSEDVALSMAIFQNEDDLLKGAYRSYPFLKKSTAKFEYACASRTLNRLFPMHPTHPTITPVFAGMASG
jgi:hypothetical protein